MFFGETSCNPQIHKSAKRRTRNSSPNTKGKKDLVNIWIINTIIMNTLLTPWRGCSIILQEILIEQSWMARYWYRLVWSYLLERARNCQPPCRWSKGILDIGYSSGFLPAMASSQGYVCLRNELNRLESAYEEDAGINWRSRRLSNLKYCHSFDNLTLRDVLEHIKNHLRSSNSLVVGQMQQTESLGATVLLSQ